MPGEYEGTALADFAAQDAAELSFAEGERLTVMDTAAPEGWLLAKNSAGKMGLVPDAYVDKPIAQSGALQPADVLADFTAEEPGELSVRARQEVHVVQSAPAPEGWVLAVRGEESGLVPAAYVQAKAAMSPPVAADGAAAMADGLRPAACRADFAAEHDTELAVGEGEVVGVLMPQPEGATDGWTAAVRLHGARGAETTAGGAASAPGLVPTEWVDLATPMETLAPFEAAEEGELTVVEGRPVWLLPLPAPDGWSEVMLATGGRGCAARPPPRPPRPPPAPVPSLTDPPDLAGWCPSRTSVWSRWSSCAPRRTERRRRPPPRWRRRAAPARPQASTTRRSPV